MNGVAPESRRIRSFFIKDILEHRNPPTTDESSPTSRAPNLQSAQTASSSYTVQNILGTNEQRPVDSCGSGNCDVCIYIYIVIHNLIYDPHSSYMG
jgi:hypothetical protein